MAKVSFPECAVIRNAGGRAVDALNSLIVLDSIIPLQSIAVIHHTGADYFSSNLTSNYKVLMNGVRKCRLWSDSRHRRLHPYTSVDTRAQPDGSDLKDEVWDNRALFVSLKPHFPPLTTLT